MRIVNSSLPVLVSFCSCGSYLRVKVLFLLAQDSRVWAITVGCQDGRSSKHCFYCTRGSRIREKKKCSGSLSLFDHSSGFQLRDGVTHRGCDSTFNSINLVETFPYKHTQRPVLKKMPILTEAAGLLQSIMYTIVLFYGDDSVLITLTCQLGIV